MVAVDHREKAASLEAMITLYHAPRTRSVRILWLLEELGVDYDLRPVEFVPTATTYSQNTPLGKLPVIVDGDVTMCESGAIIEYIVERYGEGRLAPPLGSGLRGRYLQWIHFAEGTAFPPLGIIVWHTLYLQDADKVPSAIESARVRAHKAFDFLEEQLGDDDYVLGDEFSAADIMLGFTLAAAQALGVLGDEHPRVGQYLARLSARRAFQKAAAT